MLVVFSSSGKIVVLVLPNERVTSLEVHSNYGKISRQ